MTKRTILLLWSAMIMALAIASTAVAESGWSPGKAPLMTRWAQDVSPDHPWREYPRPQLIRNEWQNLNGLWDYAIRPAAENQPAAFEGKILVPFPVESALSGVMKPVDATSRLWYRREFEIPAGWRTERVWLRFGAVDWGVTVWVNGANVGTHEGGYDPFSFDITAALKATGSQEIVLAVVDTTDAGFQCRGKQTLTPKGIFYTATTGVWQTVWLEPTGPAHIESLKITPDVDAGLVRVAIVGEKLSGHRAEVTLLSGPRDPAAGENSAKPLQSVVVDGFDQPVALSIKDARLWSPEDPYLYGLRVTLFEGDRPIDSVDSYFGMRKISLGPGEHGPRVLLNGKPIFMLGLLDQGFWPDGIYTAPTDDALRYDIELTKKFGFNTIRKHVKVEPARWYYWCDKLGVLVWQDMPSGDMSTRGSGAGPGRSPESIKAFDRELLAVIDAHYNSPAIIEWVPFNEGWGQFETERIAKLVKERDPTRLVDAASGWVDRKVGDVNDVHDYPGPDAPAAESSRALVLGEFGGLGRSVKRHLWQSADNFSYQGFDSIESLTAAYEARLADLHPLVRDPGLSGAIYTQTTDVEGEINGLVTYDRRVVKIDAARVAAANRQIHETPPKTVVIAPTSVEQPQEWRYTLEEPTGRWAEPGYDDSAWKKGPGGFGTKAAPGAVVGAEWKSGDIWLRRTIEIPDDILHNPRFLVHHDEDAEIYVDGVLAARLSGYTTHYTLAPLSDAARSVLTSGKRLLAVHCHQTSGEQYIDVGLIDRAPVAVTEAKPKENWRSLFDGKSLDGWKNSGFNRQEDAEVKDGELVIKKGAPMAGVTYTGDPMKMNYEIELDAKRVEGNDFFCALTFPVNDKPCSLVVGGWGGTLVGLSSLDGMDASENDTTKYQKFENGRWYHIRLKVTPTKIEGWIDDKQMIDAEITNRDISIRIEVGRSKPLGIATYATTAAIKNIRVRALDAK